MDGGQNHPIKNVHNYMADDTDDQKGGAGAGDGAGNDDAGKKDNGAGDGGNGGGGDDKGGGKPEPQVPLSRLREEVAKRERLEKELAGKTEVPEEERKIRDVFSKAQREEKEATEKAERAVDQKMDELQKIHGEFSRENLLKIIEDYGVYNEDGSVRWEKAMDLYNRLGGNPNAPLPKKKMPTGNRTGDAFKKEPFDPSKKTMWEIAEEAKRELHQ